MKSAIDWNTIVFGVPLKKLVPIVSATVSVTVGWLALMGKISDSQKTSNETQKSQIRLEKTMQLKVTEHEQKFKVIEEQNKNILEQFKQMRRDIWLQDHHVTIPDDLK